MFEPQHLMDLQDNGGFADSKSWLQGDGHSSPTHSRTHSSLSGATSAAAGTAGNVDRVLFNDLVEIVPLVQSLIDRKQGSSFTRRGSMIYTKTPSRESFYKKEGAQLRARLSYKEALMRGAPKPNQDASSKAQTIWACGNEHKQDTEMGTCLDGNQEKQQVSESLSILQDEYLLVPDEIINQLLEVYRRMKSKMEADDQVVKLEQKQIMEIEGETYSLCFDWDDFESLSSYEHDNDGLFIENLLESGGASEKDETIQTKGDSRVFLEIEDGGNPTQGGSTSDDENREEHGFFPSETQLATKPFAELPLNPNSNPVSESSHHDKDLSEANQITEPKGKNAAHSIPSRKQRDRGDKVQGKSGVNNQEGCVDGFSIFSSREDKEELILLREQLEDLQKKLLEKDELLKSAEIAENQMAAKLDELKHQAAEKESLMKSIQLQFSNAKIKLADKQAALEKTQWEAQASHRKVEKLQEDLDSLQGEISSYMMIFEGLTKNDSNDSTIHAEDYDIMPNHMNPLPEIDDLDELEMQKMEEAREAYVAAVAAAKDKQDEESITAAASARLHLQSFLFRTEV